MNWLQRFMYGRNGPDHLSLAVLAGGFLLAVIGRFFPYPALHVVLQMVEFLCMFLFFFRVLSRDVYKRRGENLRFLATVRGAKSRVLLLTHRVRDVGRYRYFRCPSCSQRLRVPKGKGRIRISCSRCNTDFIREV